MEEISHPYKVNSPFINGLSETWNFYFLFEQPKWGRGGGTIGPLTTLRIEHAIPKSRDARNKEARYLPTRLRLCDLKVKMREKEWPKKKKRWGRKFTWLKERGRREGKTKEFWLDEQPITIETMGPIHTKMWIWWGPLHLNNGLA